MKDETILYAEDDENDAFFMERAFARFGAGDRLRIVRNGRLATEYLKTQPSPALMLLDVKMPEMSGLEVLAWVRQQPQFKHLCVVMLTSSTQDRDIDFCAAHGANGYVVKPTKTEQLRELMPRVLAAAANFSGGRLPLPDNLLPKPS